MTLWRGVSVAALAGAAAFGQIRLVEGGKSSYSIVVGRDASPSERRGAAELQRYVEEMSGARLPVVSGDQSPRGPLVLVGNSRALERAGVRIPLDTLGPEGFALKTAGENLVIAGGRQRGTMYGVYTLLDKLGCRWFTPEVSRIPKQRTITVGPLDEIQKPAFEYREPYFTEALDKDWAARNRTNGNFQHLDESTGGKLQYYPFVHSFYQMIPPEKYFRDHPEYFSLIDGKRRTDRAQLCLTNPELLRVAVANVLEWIRQHPEATIYSVSQNDWEGWCECDNCRRVEQEEGGQHSGPLLRFVNALAAEVGKQYPDKLIDTLAYWYTENPPLHVRPRPNVRIRLCPIGVCDAHPYEKCPRSAYFMRNLEAWSKITSQLYIWHYNTNFSHYLSPFPDFDELAADLPMYRHHGVVGVFLEGAYPRGGGGEAAELRSYVMARQLWDTRTDVKQAVDEFLDGVYGHAAPAMRAYFELLERQVRFPPEGRGMHIWINPVPDYSDEFLREARALFRRAETAAGDDAVRRRVEKARLSIDYLELLRAKRFAVRGEAYAPADLAGLTERFRKFLDRVRGFGITSIHEGRELHADEEEFAARMKSYRLVTLESDAWRVDVAPELSGRVIRMIDRKTGRDALRRVDPGERDYPDQGGLAAFVYPDYHARAWTAEWSVEGTPAKDQVTLAGRTANGLVLQRRIELRAGGVHTETVLENRGDAALEAALQSRVEWDPGNIDAAAVSFQRQDGSAADRKLIQPDQPPTGSETWQDGQRPAGEWRVAGWWNRFPQAQVERTLVSWTAKGDARVIFGLWSPVRRLAPGETLRLEADYGK
ncbi:MAG TPA: DUF4838 domain-containing protein [Bryobacteraceae bacterium]|nr:DUF4838 domain-containing protein [Bryobacteraceae bacterium]